MRAPARRSLADARADLLERWQAQSDPSPFTHPDVCAAVAEAFGLSISVWTSEHSAVVAYERRMGLGPLTALALVQPPVVPVSAPVLTPFPTEAEVHKGSTDLDLLARALRETYAQATFALPSSWRDPRPFAWAGWTVEARFTYVVGLPPERQTWGSGTRQNARVHTEAYHIYTDEEALEVAAHLQVQAYHRKGIPFAPTVDQLVAIAGAVAGIGCLRTFVAYQGDALHAAALFAVAGDRATYWLAGSERGPAMTVLLAHAFDVLASEGIVELDLGGANVRSVAEFKRKFGARLVPQYRVRHIGPRWLRAVQSIRSHG